MGKRGPKGAPISDLVFWEGLWYWVFYHLRGVLPSYEKLSRNREVRKLLEAELVELKKIVTKDLVEEDGRAREIATIERDLRPKVGTSEPKVWRALVEAQTAEDVLAACRESKRWLNPKWQGKEYVRDVFDNPTKFVQSKESTYYPKRESGDEKRVAFFARVMAGISVGISPHTSIDRLRKLRHGAKCPCIHCDLTRWDRIERASYKQLWKARAHRVL